MLGEGHAALIFHLCAEVGEIGAHVDFAGAARGAASAGGAVGAAAAVDAAAVGLAAAAVVFFFGGARRQSQVLEEDEQVVASGQAIGEGSDVHVGRAQVLQDRPAAVEQHFRVEHLHRDGEVPSQVVGVVKKLLGPRRGSVGGARVR